MIAGTIDFNLHKEIILVKSTSKMQDLQNDIEDKESIIEDLKNQVNILMLKYADLKRKYQQIKKITEEPDNHANTDDGN